MSIDQNYKIVQGDNFQLVVTYLDPNSVPINLSGYTIQFQARNEPGGSILCATASVGPIPSSASIVGNDITCYSASTGKVYLNVSGTKTSSFNYPRTSYQVRAVSSNGTKTTLCKGWFEVDAGTIE
jgi:hypothetical protein